MGDVALLSDARTSQGETPALSVRNLAKTFGGARALHGVCFDVAKGEVHGLLGQNGSGKSTFVKIMAGFYSPDPGGLVSLHGHPIPLPLRAGAFRGLGLAFVHQHLGLVPSLTVLENLRVSTITARRKAVIDWRAERRAALEALARFGIRIDIDSRVAELSQVDQALVAIVRAFEELQSDARVNVSPGLLLLDEPTPFLPREGVEKLFTLVRQMTAHGASVLFISHDIDEILAITDRATVLRDGEVVGRLVTRNASKDEFVERIVGRRVERLRSDRKPASSKAVRASLRNVSDHRVQSMSLDLHEGEIVGLTGLIGSGYERIPYLVFGAKPSTSGTLTLDGVEHNLLRMTPSSAVRNGIALLPADRQHMSGVGSLSVGENLMVLALHRFVRWGRLDRGALGRRVRALCAHFEVRPSDSRLPLSALSGGNAQKVLIAKWMSQRPRLLMLDEPTQGVDIGARQQLLTAIKDAAQQGSMVLCASTDFEQLADLCDRVVIFARGKMHDELTGTDVTKENIAERCYASVSLDIA